MPSWLSDAYRVRRAAVSARLHGLVRVLVGGFAASLAGYLATGALGIAVQTLIVRQLGVERYGDYALLLASLALIATVLGLGLDTWLLKDGGHTPANLEPNVWNVLLLKLIGSGVVLAGLAVGWSNHVVYTPAFLVSVVGMILASFVQTGYAALRATRHNVQVALFQTLEPALMLVALLVTSATDLSVLLLMSVRTAVNALLFVVLMQRVLAICGGFSFSLALGRVLRGAGLYVAADGFANVYSQVTIVILGIAAGSAAVGTFRPAVDLVTIFYTVPNLLFLVALPLLSTAGIQQQEFLRLIALMAGGCLLYGLGVLGGLWLLGEWLVTRLYGPEYLVALPFVQVISLAPLLKAGSFVAVSVMLARDRVHYRLLAQSIVTALSLGVGWAVVPFYGPVGAAWMVLGVEVGLFVLYSLGAVVAVRRTMKDERRRLSVEH
jgi:O-antigen/teichoic acid export membrane protein